MCASQVSCGVNQITRCHSVSCYLSALAPTTHRSSMEFQRLKTLKLPLWIPKTLCIPCATPSCDSWNSSTRWKRWSRQKSRICAADLDSASTYCGVVDFAGQERTTGTFPLEASGTEEEVQKDGKASEPSAKEQQRVNQSTPVLAGMDVSDVMSTWWLVQLLLLLHRLQRSRGLVLSCNFPGALSLHFLMSRDRTIRNALDRFLCAGSNPRSPHDLASLNSKAPFLSTLLTDSFVH